MSYKVKHSPTAGRFLVATRPIAAGAVVLQDEPYAAVIDDDHVAELCDHCFRPSANLARCSKSKLARYCCREHQQAAWRAGFRQEAAALAHLHPKVPPPTLRLAARAIWRHLRNQEAAGSSGGDAGWEAVMGLQEHWQQLGEEAKATYAQMAIVVREYLAAGGTPQEAMPEPRVVAGLLARCAANCHTVCDEELRPVGVGLYPLAALANHSCRPSCMQSFRGATIIFRALRPIAVGEEVSISYIELAALRRDRRQQLLAAYFFDVDRPCPPLPPPSACPADRNGAASGAAASAATPPAAPAAAAGDLAAAPACQHGALQPSLLDGQHGALQPSLLDGQEQQQQQQPDQEQPLAGKAAAVAPVATTVLQPSGAVLRVYQCDAGGHPPWPCDDSDTAATELLLGGSSGTCRGHSIMAWPAAARSSIYGEPSGRVAEDEEEQCSSGGLAVDYWGPAASPSPSSQLEAAAGVVVAALQGVLAAQAAAKEGKHEAARTKALAALRQMDTPGAALGRCHVLRMLANAAAMKAAIDAGGPWDAALEAARHLLPPYQLLYPAVWPNLGLHWALVAKLQALQEGPQAARAALAACRSALRCLSITHPGTGVAAEMQSLLAQLQQELAHGPAQQ